MTTAGKIAWLTITIAGLLTGCRSTQRFMPPADGTIQKSEHFTLVSGAPASTTEPLLQTCDETWTWLSEKLGSPPTAANAPVSIYLYRDRAEFDRCRPNGMDEVIGISQTVKVGGGFQKSSRTIGLFVETDAERELTEHLRHEVTHAFLCDLVDGRMLPEYVNEGLAYCIGWSVWPPASDTLGPREIKPYMELELYGSLGIDYPVTRLVETPTSIMNLLLGGRFGSFAYHATSAQLMRMILHEAKYDGLLADVFARSARAQRSTLVKSSEEHFLAALHGMGISPTELELDLQAYRRRLRTMLFTELCETKEDYVQLAKTLKLRAFANNQEISLDNLTWEQIIYPGYLVLDRDPADTFIGNAIDLEHRANALQERTRAVAATSAPKPLVGKVRRMLVELEAHRAARTELEDKLGPEDFKALLLAGSSERDLDDCLYHLLANEMLLEAWLMQHGN